MTHRIASAVLVVVAAALLAAPVATSGVSTYHGAFTGAEGWLYTQPPPDTSNVVYLGDLFLKGPWNVAVADDAVVGDTAQVTGEPIFQTTSGHCGWPYGPCGQWFPLGWRLGGALPDWTIVERTGTTLALDKTFPWFPDGSVFFTYHLVLNTSTGELTITMPIEGRKCPYGWHLLVFHGGPH